MLCVTPRHAAISGRRHGRVKRRVHVLLLALLGGLLSGGCSGPRLAYEQIDVLVPWYFRDYVDLNTGQRQQLKRAVESMLAWHRESEVGRYAAFFRELESDAAGPLGRERIDAARMKLEAFWDDFIDRLAPDAAALLATLDQTQVEQIIGRIKDEDREFAEKVLDRSPGERVERREKRLRRELERWVGKLDESQRLMVAECARGMRADPEGWLDSRQRWRQALDEALGQRADLAVFTPRLDQLLADGESFWSPGYRRQFDDDRQRVLQLIADVDASLSAAQRRRLQARLGRWASDLESIAGGSQGSSAEVMRARPCGGNDRRGAVPTAPRCAPARFTSRQGRPAVAAHHGRRAPPGVR
jgi:hypothetical protein